MQQVDATTQLPLGLGQAEQVPLESLVREIARIDPVDFRTSCCLGCNEGRNFEPLQCLLHAGKRSVHPDREGPAFYSVRVAGPHQILYRGAGAARPLEVILR